MEERYHATTQKRFYTDMSNVNKNITVQTKPISPPTYIHHFKNTASFQYKVTPIRRGVNR